MRIFYFQFYTSSVEIYEVFNYLLDKIIFQFYTSSVEISFLSFLETSSSISFNSTLVQWKFIKFLKIYFINFSFNSTLVQWKFFEDLLHKLLSNVFQFYTSSVEMFYTVYGIFWKKSFQFYTSSVEIWNKIFWWHCWNSFNSTLVQWKYYGEDCYHIFDSDFRFYTSSVEIFPF